MSEAKMIINGTELTEAQSMAVRCAVSSFMRDMVNDGLGDDEHGKLMAEAYYKRCVEVTLLICGPEF